MFYVTHKPAPPLGEFVDYLWLLGDAPPHARERIVPSGTLELVVNLAEDEIRVYDPRDLARVTRRAGAVVSGAFRRAFVVDTREHASIIGAHFKPGGACPFLGAATDTLADAHVELAALWGARDARTLREQLCDAATPDARFAVLERALLAHLFRPLDHRRAVRVALAQLARASRVSIGALADGAGISHRRFIEVFGAEVGITPKLFWRIGRFRRALARAGAQAAPRWAALALECGYADQSHLIRDFVEFAGLTPAAYLRHRAARVKDHHIALAE